MKRMSINEFLANPEVNSDDCFNFYDWFCSESSLKRRMMSMAPKLKFLVKENIIDGDSLYVWFKNNCPCDGSLYDDMRISTLDEKQDFLGGFCPRTGHKVENKCSVWLIADNATSSGLEENVSVYEFKTWSDFKKEVKTNTVFKEKLRKHFTAK